MRHSVLLRRYMLTMVCMILIPCCLLLTLFYSSLSGNLIREAENMLQSQAQAVMDVYDSAIAACVQTSVQISNDSVISPYNLRSNRYESVEALQRLRLYGIQLDFCDAILLNLRGEETLYSQNGLIGLDALLRFAGEEFSMLKQQYTDLLNTCDSIFFTPPDMYINAGNGKHYLVLFSPWSMHGHTVGTLLFQINAETFFANLFGSLTNASVDAFCVRDEKNRVLYAYNATDVLPQSAEAGIASIRFNGRAASLITCSSTQSDWTLSVVMSHGKVASILHNIHFAGVSWTILALLIVWLIWGVIIAYRFWLPLHQMVKSHAKASPQAANARQNELKILDECIRCLQAENAQQRMQAALEAERQRLLYALLHDSIPLSMDFDHQLNNAGIQLSGPLLRVLSLSVADMNAASCTQFMAACGEIPSVYAVDMAYKNIIACVYSTQASTEPTLHARILHCCEIWAGDSFSAGLSSACAQIADLKRCFAESILALENALAENARLKTYAAEEKPRENWKESLERIASALEAGMRYGNEEILRNALTDWQTLSTALRQNPECAAYVRHVLIYRLGAIAQERGMECNSAFLAALIHKDTDGAFFEALSAFSRQIAADFQSQRLASNNMTYQKVVDFIEDHYCDQNMSLAMLANQFDMSTPYMSRFFLEHSGVNFVDYLSEKRMSRACELLLTTDLTVREVVEIVGYCNVSSFTRKFSELYGTSPGRFRSNR